MMRAKEFLHQVEKLDKVITNKLIEKEQWMSIATSTAVNSSDGDRVQASGSQQKMADAVLKMIEVEEEIDRCIDKLVYAKKDVISTIELLPVNEYDLIHKVYIQFKSLDEASELMNKSYSWAATVHGRALKHVQDILDGRVDMK